MSLDRSRASGGPSTPHFFLLIVTLLKYKYEAKKLHNRQQLYTISKTFRSKWTNSVFILIFPCMTLHTGHNALILCNSLRFVILFKRKQTTRLKSHFCTNMFFTYIKDTVLARVFKQLFLNTCTCS